MLLGPVPDRPGGLDPEETCALLERVLAQAGAGQGQGRALQTLDTRHPCNYGRTLMARDTTMTSVRSEIVLSSIINILARRVSGKTSVGLNAVAVLYPRKR